MANTSVPSDTKQNLRFLRNSFGTSSRFLRFASGRVTVSILARRAARTFSFTPPIGRTLPRRVISPVMATDRSEEHTSELQSRLHLVCRLLLEKKKQSN